MSCTLPRKKASQDIETKKRKKSSVFVVGRTSHTHEVLGSLSESGVCAFVLIIRTASLKENLLGDHVVADKHRGIDTGFLRHAMIAPVELAFGKVFLILFSPIGIGSTRGATSATVGATRCARRGDGRTATSIAAARASMVASNVAPDTSAATRARVGAACIVASQSEDTIRLGAGVPDHVVLHVIKGKSMSSVDVSKKFLVSFLVSRCGREVEAH